MNFGHNENVYMLFIDGFHDENTNINDVDYASCCKYGYV